jgi:hypothetical protein
MYNIWYKHKPTTIKNPQANAILECLHQVLAQMLCTAELNMAKTVTPDDVNVFLDNVTWAICSTYHTVLNSLSAKSVLAGEKLVATYSISM